MPRALSASSSLARPSIVAFAAALQRCARRCKARSGRGGAGAAAGEANHVGAEFLSRIVSADVSFDSMAPRFHWPLRSKIDPGTKYTLRRTGTTRVAPAAAGSSPSSSPSTSRIASVSTVKPPRSSRAISAVSRQETSARHERARQRYSVSCSQQLPNPCGPTYAKHKHWNRCRTRERLDR